MATVPNNLEQLIQDYLQDDRILTIIGQVTQSEHHPDMTLSRELKGMLAFSKQSKQHVRGPEDLETAQLVLDELHAYRDRSVEICLDAVEHTTIINRWRNLLRDYLLTKPDVAARTESLKTAIVGQVAEKIDDVLIQWEVIHKQAEMILRNCRDAYNFINTQSEIAKQQWFQRPRIDATDQPKAQVLSRM